MKSRFLMATCGAAMAVTASVVPAVSAQASEHAARWSDTGQRYYWYESCREAGEGGVRTEGWEAWDCKGSSAPWSQYQLWKLD